MTGARGKEDDDWVDDWTCEGCWACRGMWSMLVMVGTSAMVPGISGYVTMAIGLAAMDMGADGEAYWRGIA